MIYLHYHFFANHKHFFNPFLSDNIQRMGLIMNNYIDNIKFYDLSLLRVSKYDKDLALEFSLDIPIHNFYLSWQSNMPCTI